MGVLRARWSEDDVTRLYREHLAGYAERPSSFENDEHLVLRVMKVIWTDALSRSEDVESSPELASCGTRCQAHSLRVVVGLPKRSLQRDFIDIAYESLGEGGCAIIMTFGMLSGESAA